MDELDDATLDRLLDRIGRPVAAPALERRILADFDRIPSRWTVAKLLHEIADTVWPGGPVWQPATAFALALLAGIGIATFAPTSHDVASSGNTFESITTPVLSGAIVEVGFSDCV